MKIYQAVILAGGRGERLKPYTNNKPKPLVEVNGSPFVDYILNILFKNNITKILFLTGYRSKLITQRYYNCKKLNIEFSKGKLNWKTGKRIFNAHHKLDKYFLLLYGDIFYPLNLNLLIKNYKKNRKPVIVTIFNNKNGTSEYGNKNNIKTINNMVVKYDKSKNDNSCNGVDIGYYIIDKKIINKKNYKNFSFEEDFLPDLINQQQLSAYRTSKQYYFLTDKKSLQRNKRIFSKKNLLPFLIKKNFKKIS